MQDYLEILNMILKYDEKTNHLKNYIAPVIADWPGQLFIRRAITHLHKNNSKAQIPLGVISFVPILGPLHVSLNSREQVIQIFYSFFKKLFHSVFGLRKKFAKKPRPWRINLLLELVYSAWIKIRSLITEKFGPLCKFTEYQTLIDLIDNIISAKRKNYNKAPLAFLSDIFYWEQNNPPIKEVIKLFLVNFNDYWIENIHSRIRSSTTCKDNADNIQKQAYLLDANKHSAFKEAFMNTKHYPYSPSELEFLTNKTCLFLLQQFQLVFEEYQKILKINTTSSTTKPKPKSKKDKKEKNLNLKFITMEDIDERVLPTGYHTSYPPIFNSCDNCHKLFEQDSDGTILICGHGYHWNCYNQLEFKCKHCIKYFNEGIWSNVKSFVKRLEAEDKDKLTKEDLEDEDENDDENDDDDTNNLTENSENIKISEKEKIELDLQNAINNIKTW
ncbi:hypothetical protein F8M41_020848 [Gigaspora margarita]|uniref:RING-type domain-containing protein n=1 Tax=Gigaspora margarita TaxID=4874 RepID=A0A8H4AHR8_GIGMA|nr:hypothetical protein F8M41_020848 [Gigaspora margarita]